MSCGDYRKGKGATGYDFDKGRRTACLAIGAERVAHQLRYNEYGLKRVFISPDWHPDRFRKLCKPATDIVSAHFEHDGAIIPDPYFELAQEPAPPRKRSELDRLIARLNKLSADELIQLSEAVDAAFEAAE
jgi:hypothetical protein